MWIKESPENISAKSSGRDVLNFLFNHDIFYVMDNHLAAAWCWLQKLDKNTSYNFFHIDQHEDLWCNAPIESYSYIKSNQYITLDEFLSLKYVSCINCLEKVFNYGNYILQTNKLYPNWFENCIFACEDYITDINLNILDNLNHQELLPKINEFLDSKNTKKKSFNKWILNIDIDYFFDEKQNQIMDDEYIKQLCLKISTFINNIEIITISLSPEYCGGWDKSYRIANIMTDIFGFNFELQL